MRLQLTRPVLLLTGLLALGGLLLPCSPQPQALRAGYRRFADETVRVSSPRVDSVVAFGEDLSLSPYWTADVITAASPAMAAPDVISRATEYAETRHEAGLGAEWRPAEVRRMGGTYTLSVEPDYVSHTTGVWAAVEVLDRLATVRAAARLGLDAVGRADDAGFEERLTTGAGDLSWTHVLSPELLLEVAYSAEFRQGFQSNAYRLVPIYDPLGERPRLTLPERVPEQRVRQAAELVLAWAATPSLYLHASYRLYGDDWDVLSHTAGAELWLTAWADRVRFRLRGRAYRQRSADFYAARYESERGYLTGDWRLSPMSTVTAGGRAELRVGEWVDDLPLTVSAGYDLTLFAFDDYAVRDSMLGHLLSVALEWEVP